MILNDNSNQKKISNYFRCSLELNKKKEEKKIFPNYNDKKLTDYFDYKKEKVEIQNKKENNKSNIKSNKKSSEKNKSRSTSNNKVNQKKKKSNKNDKIKEILELLNIDY